MTGVTEVVAGHEIVVTHEGSRGPVYTPICHATAGATCRLVCVGHDCADWAAVQTDEIGRYHLYEGERHEMLDSGECQAIVWLNESDCLTELAYTPVTFEIGRFPINTVWVGGGVEWEKT